MHVTSRFADVAVIIGPQFERDYEYDIVGIAGVEDLPVSAWTFEVFAIPFVIVERRSDESRIAVGISREKLKGDPASFADDIRLEVARLFIELDEQDATK